MKELIVVIPHTQVYGMMPMYLRQLDAAKIDTHLEHLESIPNGNGGGTHGYAVQLMRRCCQRFLEEYETIIFTDAFDVLFYGTKQEVLSKIPRDYVLLAAERNCYPEKLDIPGRTPWRYVNCGLTAGTPKNILEWLDRQERHPEYNPQGLNQGFFNRRRQQASELAFIDERTELFYCLYGEQGELQFRDGVPVNTYCGTTPNFLHANGKCGFPPEAK